MCSHLGWCWAQSLTHTWSTKHFQNLHISRLGTVHSHFSLHLELSHESKIRTRRAQTRTCQPNKECKHSYLHLERGLLDKLNTVHCQQLRNALAHILGKHSCCLLEQSLLHMKNTAKLPLPHTVQGHKLCKNPVERTELSLPGKPNIHHHQALKTSHADIARKHCGQLLELNRSCKWSTALGLL